ncbi:MAG TPA: biopolymer transporter ExbD [Chitinispirillaceae bacterium]|nr:biopolymer transporter ExbD [Chitinispirillaceae bacterium]
MSFLKDRFEQKADSAFRPQLTSLVDVMTILLVFLIKSFSVEGNLITPSQDLVLPVSSSEKLPQLRTSIEITKNAVISEGHTIVTMEELSRNDSMVIKPLFDWMKVVHSRNKNPKTVSSLLIQCDREIEFSVVKKVMFSCSKAGFIDFSVLVVQEE